MEDLTDDAPVALATDTDSEDEPAAESQFNETTPVRAVRAKPNPAFSGAVTPVADPPAGGAGGCGGSAPPHRRRRPPPPPQIRVNIVDGPYSGLHGTVLSDGTPRKDGELIHIRIDSPCCEGRQVMLSDAEVEAIPEQLHIACELAKAVREKEQAAKAAEEAEAVAKAAKQELDMKEAEVARLGMENAKLIAKMDNDNAQPKLTKEEEEANDQKFEAAQAKHVAGDYAGAKVLFEEVIKLDSNYQLAREMMDTMTLRIADEAKRRKALGLSASATDTECREREAMQAAEALHAAQRVAAGPWWQQKAAFIVTALVGALAKETGVHLWKEVGRASAESAAKHAVVVANESLLAAQMTIAAAQKSLSTAAIADVPLSDSPVGVAVKAVPAYLLLSLVWLAMCLVLGCGTMSRNRGSCDCGFMFVGCTVVCALCASIGNISPAASCACSCDGT